MGRCLVLAVILALSASIFVSIGLFNSVLAQSDDKTFTAPKFGLSMKYPSDWTFIQEEQDFRPEGSASLGDFCPTSAVGNNPKVLDCHMNLELDVPVYLSVSAFKLKEGTTLKEFYDQKVAEMELSNDIVGRKNIETNDIKVSGLSAIQTAGITGGGSLDKLLKEIGRDNPKSKHMDVYVVNGGTGYRIWASTDDEQDYDRYIPTIQKMIDSFQIQGAKESSDNTSFVPETKNVPTEDVVLLSQRLKKGGGDYNDIVGQVRNIGTDAVEFVKIGLTVYDGNGDVIGTDSTYLDATSLEPNQKSSFDILSNKDNFDGMESYELSLQWQSSDGTEEYVDNAKVYKDNSTESTDDSDY